MHGKYSPTPRKNKPSSSHSASSHSMANMNSLSCASLFTTLLLFLLLTNIEAAAPRRSLSAGDTAAQFLNPHNALRTRLGLSPLQWDNKLVSYAKWYANQRRGDCALEHSTGNYGENLFWGKGKGWKISDAVAAWAAEQKFYNYNQNSCQPDQDCTHYTQMVWRTTQRIGCAKIICNSGDTFLICNYDPHGNIIGARPY